MLQAQIVKFEREFQVNEVIIKATFSPMNTRTKTLYQVCFLHEGKSLRCHMQIADGIFKLTDAHRIPEIYHVLENEFAKAIMDS